VLVARVATVVSSCTSISASPRHLASIKGKVLFSTPRVGGKIMNYGQLIKLQEGEDIIILNPETKKWMLTSIQG